MGRVKEWTVSVHKNPDDTAVLRKEFGIVGKKIQKNERTIKNGKNIGKANETTPVEQALSEAESAINVKKHSNHVEFVPDPKTFKPPYLLPQLAKGVKKGKIKFPAYIQPKLNGVCNLSEITESGVLHHSRGGQLFETLAHLDGPLRTIFPEFSILHGELYVHGWSLQKIGSYTKELKEDAHRLQFWIYDLADPSLTFEQRWRFLQRYMRNNTFDPMLHLVPTVVVNDYGEAKTFHDKCVQSGYEGAMLRNMDGFYLFEFNSNDLEKVKQYQDAEFVIVGGKEGVGNDEGCVVFRCSTEDGKEFDVRPRGTVEDRRRMYDELDSFVGEQLTVRFAEYSDDGIPLQPVGIVVRDYE